MKLIKLFLCVVMFLCLHAIPSFAAVEDYLDATCRISSPAGVGTGCVFEISNGYIYILTAGHVVGNQLEVNCEFWQVGHQSSPMRGRVISRINKPRSDAAIIILHTDQFGGRLPMQVPVAPRGTKLTKGSKLSSAGCANGAWSTAWQGHVLDYDGTDLTFVPSPADGRSGSAIFDEEGRIVGIIRARTIDASIGIATGLEALYEEFGRDFEERKTQCGPAGCLTPPQSGGARIISPDISIGRTIINPPSPRPPVPWPTLPPPSSPAPAPIPSQPPVDMGPLYARLDQMAGDSAAFRQWIVARDDQNQAEKAKKEDQPNGLLIALIAVGAVLVGAFLFFTTQNHTA